MSKEIEVIKHAAIKTKDNWIFIGKCHGDCFEKSMNINKTPCSKAESQGFVTSFGRYVNREEAAKIASTVMKACAVGGVLISEDLWHEEYGGCYDYSEIEGYILKEQILTHKNMPNIKKVPV